MDKTNDIVTNEELAAAFGGGKPLASDSQSRDSNNSKQVDKHSKKSGTKHQWDRLTICFFAIAGLCFVGGVTMLLFSLLAPPEVINSVQYPDLAKKDNKDVVYSDLTGEVLSDVSLKTSPAYCIQTPNGTDGARPHAGLDQAGVIFEAIAESGITRFAAIYQNPTASIIGPIRSLRIYYLQWDTPFDCTIVHAGGSADALAAVSNGYKDLTEDYSYMYRGTYASRRWNNLFTSAAALKRYSDEHGYTTSNIKGFTRMTPEESQHTRVDALTEGELDITKPSKTDTSALKPTVSSVSFRLGGWGDYNVHYEYDANSNKYFRSYESGDEHSAYTCPESDNDGSNPEDACTLTQMAPSVVIAMMVSERRASDNYHEDIDVIGSGDAYIFQNGIALRGTWKKTSADSQIQFTDSEGKEIRLAPGQTFITAVPNYGSVDF